MNICERNRILAYYLFHRYTSIHRNTAFSGECDKPGLGLRILGITGNAKLNYISCLALINMLYCPYTMQNMKFFAWLLVLLSAFCVAFARLDNGFNTDRRALLRTSTGNRIVPLTARNLKAVTTQALDDDDDEDDDAEEDDISEPDTEADFASDVDSIDGESDAGCPTGVYTLKYIAKERFATGKKTKEVKSNNIVSLHHGISTGFKRL